MKKKWIIILIIFLLAANAALIATLAIDKNAGNSQSTGENREQIKRKSERSGGFEQHIAEELNLSEHQKTQLKEFSEAFHETRFEHFDKIHQLKKQYFTSLTSEKSEAELKELADSLGKIHAEMMLLDYQHYKNIRSICTEEQAQIFDSLGNKHITNRKFYRKNSRHGRRHQESGEHMNNNKRKDCNENK